MSALVVRNSLTLVFDGRAGDMWRLTSARKETRG